MIKSGREYAKENKQRCPWMWAWHESEYFGGAQGVSGIIYTLLCIPSIVKKYEKELKTMLDFCQKFKFQSGKALLLPFNSLPLPPPSPSFSPCRTHTHTHTRKNQGIMHHLLVPYKMKDTLVQWCHGAPGFLSMYSKLSL